MKSGPIKLRSGLARPPKLESENQWKNANWSWFDWLNQLKVFFTLLLKILLLRRESNPDLGCGRHYSTTRPLVFVVIRLTSHIIFVCTHALSKSIPSPSEGNLKCMKALRGPMADVWESPWLRVQATTSVWGWVLAYKVVWSLNSQHPWVETIVCVLLLIINIMKQFLRNSWIPIQSTWKTQCLTASVWLQLC